MRNFSVVWAMLAAVLAMAAQSVAAQERATPVEIVNDPVRTPLVVFLNPPWGGGGLPGNRVNKTFTTPPDSIFVIEQLSVVAPMDDVAGGNRLEQVSLSTTIDGRTGIFSVELPPEPLQIASPEVVTQVASQAGLRSYAGPGTVVRVVLVSAAPNAVAPLTNITVSGYLVPADSPTISP